MHSSGHDNSLKGPDSGDWRSQEGPQTGPPSASIQASGTPMGCSLAEPGSEDPVVTYRNMFLFLH
ncbi:hypothetical protein EYF80_031877 [Liparis tanakae]|uniref:Uncharacterized protein n=1 Tax=Liparis tanakae TaxID=230148 RepID=A0A4Z2GWB9_9TELE|nr:hypothetical protein EYF80_031877 [Liparis tanakae]